MLFGNTSTYNWTGSCACPTIEHNWKLLSNDIYYFHLYTPIYIVSLFGQMYLVNRVRSQNLICANYYDDAQPQCSYFVINRNNTFLWAFGWMWLWKSACKIIGPTTALLLEWLNATVLNWPSRAHTSTQRWRMTCKLKTINNNNNELYMPVCDTNII